MVFLFFLQKYCKFNFPKMFLILFMTLPLQNFPLSRHEKATPSDHAVGLNISLAARTTDTE
jgi:hypothetical protein